MGEKHVLIVEDDPLVSSTIADMLQDEGHRTTRVQTASEVRALLDGDGSGVDVVLLDLGLGREEGFSLLTLARERRVPVVLMSGAPQAILDGDGIDLPSIAKPFRMHELLAVLGLGPRN